MLSRFLRGLHCSLKPNPESKFVIVTGNESCDLDSIACSTSYAYIKSKENPENNVTYIPFCNIPEFDMNLRTEVTFWLNTCKIDKTDLFYSGSLDWLLAPGAAKELAVILVDHLESESGNAFNKCPVEEIIDHHPIFSGYKRPGSCTNFIAEKVGSCSSLIAEELFKRLPKEMIPIELCQLLYGAILIDNDGLSEKALEIQKATRRDLEAARKLEAFAGEALLTEGASRAFVFKEIMESKFNITGLSLWDLFRRDCKRVGIDKDSKADIVCSTITGMDFKELSEHSDFKSEAARFCQEQGARTLVCVTVGPAWSDACHCPHKSPAGTTDLPNFVRRGIVVTSPDEHRAFTCRLWAYLMGGSRELQLRRPLSEMGCGCGERPDAASVHIAEITNKAATRKQLMPILMDFLRSLNAAASPLSPPNPTRPNLV